MTAEKYLESRVYKTFSNTKIVRIEDALKAIEMARNEKANTPVGLQGWICPKCGRVYSPYTSCCNFCGNFDFSKVTCTTRLENSNSNIQQPLGDLTKMQ